MSKNKDKKKIPLVAVIVIVAVLLFVVISLFPRRHCLLDGGTVRYSSIGLGAIYEIEFRHRLVAKDGKVYYEVGTIISVLRKEIYNNVYIDYDYWKDDSQLAEVEEKDRLIESILNSSNK